MSISTNRLTHAPPTLVPQLSRLASQRFTGYRFMRLQPPAAKTCSSSVATLARERALFFVRRVKVAGRLRQPRKRSSARRTTSYAACLRSSRTLLRTRRSRARRKTKMALQAVVHWSRWRRRHTCWSVCCAETGFRSLPASPMCLVSSMGECMTSTGTRRALGSVKSCQASFSHAIESDE